MFASTVRTQLNLAHEVSPVFEAALPDNYGWGYEALAEHLNTLRNQYLGLTTSGWR